MQLVFTKTRILSVKVATLETFFAMVKTLDQVRCLRNILYMNIVLTIRTVKSDPEASPIIVQNPD